MGRQQPGIGVGTDLPRELLERLYHAVLTDEIRIEQREYIRGASREGWLVKRGGRIKTWKRRWVVLAAGGVLYYFDDPKAAAPKGVVPLEDVIVRYSAERAFAFSLAHSEDEGALIKSAKASHAAGQRSSSLVQGHHDTFIFPAESEHERQLWVRALKKEVYQSHDGVASCRRRARRACLARQLGAGGVKLRPASMSSRPS